MASTLVQTQRALSRNQSFLGSEAIVEPVSEIATSRQLCNIGWDFF